MTKDDFNNVLRMLADAWARRDYVTAAGYFVEDVRYADPLRYFFDNRADLLAFFEDDQNQPQYTVWHTVIFDEEKKVGVAEYTYDGTHRYHGIVLIKVEDHLITHWREYQHVDSREWQEFISGTIFS